MGVGAVVTLFYIVLIGSIFALGESIPLYSQKLLDDIGDVWNDKEVELDLQCEDPILYPGATRQRKYRMRGAVKVAVKVIADVGYLTASKANSLVYQRKCLDVMAEMKMRNSDIVRYLPVAVLACMERSDEIAEALETIDLTISGKVGQSS